jgi:pimeloyl-ACP methyl ester carboxylesterase
MPSPFTQRTYVRIARGASFPERTGAAPNFDPGDRPALVLAPSRPTIRTRYRPRWLFERREHCRGGAVAARCAGGAILLRAIVPLSHEPQADLTGKPVLILSGARDPIIPVADAERLASMLKQACAAVEHHTLPSGMNSRSLTLPSRGHGWKRKQ